MKDIDAYTSRGGAGHEPRHDPATDVIIQVPAGFRHEEALKEICIFLIGWLHTGGTVREALRRLRGWVPEGEG